MKFNFLGECIIFLAPRYFGFLKRIHTPLQIQSPLLNFNLFVDVPIYFNFFENTNMNPLGILASFFILKPTSPQDLSFLRFINVEY